MFNTEKSVVKGLVVYDNKVKERRLGVTKLSLLFGAEERDKGQDLWERQGISGRSVTEHFEFKILERGGCAWEKQEHDPDHV